MSLIALFFVLLFFVFTQHLLYDKTPSEIGQTSVEDTPPPPFEVILHQTTLDEVRNHYMEGMYIMGVNECNAYVKLDNNATAHGIFLNMDGKHLLVQWEVMHFDYSEFADEMRNLCNESQ